MPERVEREHVARAARNQALFRDVNESIKDVNEAFGELAPLTDWICECAEPTCTQRIALTIDEYEWLREAPTRFAVAPGVSHVVPDVEDVVRKSKRYWVVEKIGSAGRLVASVDPRADDQDRDEIRQGER